MARRRRRSRTGLLILLIICFSSPLYAQDESQPLVIMQKSSQEPVSGSIWNLTLLIAHEDPNEVTILAPPFTGSLYLEQVLKGPRIIDLENWTFQEYRFILSSPDIIEFDSFTIITPYWQALTEPFELEILSPKTSAETQQIRFSWEGIPPSLQTGQSITLSLKLNYLRQAIELPDEDFFLPPLAEGIIMESLKPTAEEKAGGTALILRITPMEAKPFILSRRELSLNNYKFEIPALNIKVNLPVKKTDESVIQNVDFDEDKKNNFLFPDITIIKDLPLFIDHKLECEKIYYFAKKLWKEDKKAQAIAILRLNERDHQAGNVFETLRVKAEQTLGLKNTGVEKDTSVSGKKVLRAVLMETAFRRIPDLRGDEVAVLNEGQPVLVSSTAIKNEILWRRIITNDKRKISGWIPEEKIIFY